MARIRTAPRKAPTQQRSRATVDAIIEAGFICVAELGITGTTTRHIAERAGISVGSLYEYFSNKQAIYEAMNQRMVTDVVAMIQPLLPQLTIMLTVTVVSDGIFLLGYAKLAAHGTRALTGSRVVSWLERGFGAVLIFFGIKLLLSRR